MMTRPTGELLSICGVIPARMESKRFPGKPLRLISGRPIIDWVYRGARESRALDRLIVATDSAQIISYCKEKVFEATMTSHAHASGTDRLIEVLEQQAAAGRAADVYVNIQGDEPMVTASHIDLLISGLQAHSGVKIAGPSPDLSRQSAFDSASAPRDTVQVSTLKVAMTSEAAADQNAVKVVTDTRGLALYFSRAPIPYDRDPSGGVRYYKHLGFYAYTAEALRRFGTLAPSPLERVERLEQLRFLENGIPMAVIETDQDTIGVDTEEDLRRVEEYFEGRVANRE